MRDFYFLLNHKSCYFETLDNTTKKHKAENCRKKTRTADLSVLIKKCTMMASLYKDFVFLNQPQTQGCLPSIIRLEESFLNDVHPNKKRQRAVGTRLKTKVLITNMYMCNQKDGHPPSFVVVVCASNNVALLLRF